VSLLGCHAQGRGTIFRCLVDVGAELLDHAAHRSDEAICSRIAQYLGTKANALFGPSPELPEVAGHADTEDGLFQNLHLSHLRRGGA
jgi:hypothetical protein